MKSHLLGLAIGLLLPLWGVSAEPSRSAENELQQITQSLLDAIAPGDKAVWEEYLDPRLIQVDENGVTRGKQEILAELQPLPTGLVGHLEIVSFKVELHGNVAVATHVDQEYLDYRGQPLRTRFHSTDTWLRGPRGWRLIAEQTLALLADPPAVTLPQSRLCEYNGTYRLTDAISTTVQCSDSGLSFQRAGRSTSTYRAEVADVFFLPGEPRTRRIFQRNGAGRLTGFVDRREGQDILWALLAPEAQH